MTTLTIFWKASQDLMRRETILTGKTTGSARVININMAEMSEEQRAAALAVAHLNEDKLLFSINIQRPTRQVGDRTTNDFLYLDGEPTLADAIAIASASIALEKEAIAEAKQRDAAEKQNYMDSERRANDEFADLQSRYNEIVPQLQTILAQEDLVQRITALESWTLPAGGLASFPAGTPPYMQHRFRFYGPSLSELRSTGLANARRELEERAKATWIAEHGSDYLKRSVAGGYDSTYLYLTERAAFEYPAGTLDYQQTARWRDRSTPTLEALDNLDALQEQYPHAECSIVWMIMGPNPHQYDSIYDFIEQEAIVLSDKTYGGRPIVFLL